MKSSNWAEQQVGKDYETCAIISSDDNFAMQDGNNRKVHDIGEAHDVTGRERLRSAIQQLMVVPHLLSTAGCRAFTVQGPTVWNYLPAQQDYVLFKQCLKSWLLSRY